MQSKYTSRKIEAIWSPDETRHLMRVVWTRCMEWLEKEGFKDSTKRGKYAAPRESSEHEVVDELRAFVHETGYLNAHAGLTSSDVVDNVRLIQSERSLQVILGLIDEVVGQLKVLEDWQADCLGYTHWQPAARTTMGARFGSHAAILYGYAAQITGATRAKKVGGATGTRWAISQLTGKYPVETHPDLPDLAEPLENVYMQSTTHMEELDAASWLASVMAQVHKLAQDIRFLCHTGELQLQHGDAYVGSSSMPGKNNPMEFEQICALARRQPSYARQIWDCAAFNGLERTLDNSAMLRETLPQMYNNAAYCLEKMAASLPNLTIDRDRCKQLIDKYVKAATGEGVEAEEIAAGKITKIKTYERKN